jgi:hypothetical protein
MRHIREAKHLTRELGGTDQDVKRYFFGLSPAELRPILNAYEREHGRGAREYAEATIPQWRSGARQMSGQNAARLFKLLPRFMPLQRKLGLVEALWERLAPRAVFSIAFGRNADTRAVGELVGQHMQTTINGHTIPEALQRRFTWLADGDAQVMQELLNHFLIRDRQQAIATVSAQVALILRNTGPYGAVQGFRREVKVGGHTVHVFLDPLATDVKLSPGPPRYLTALNYSWVWVLGGVAALVALLFLLLPRRTGVPNERSKSPATRQAPSGTGFRTRL